MILKNKFSLKTQKYGNASFIKSCPITKEFFVISIIIYCYNNTMFERIETKVYVWRTNL